MTYTHDLLFITIKDTSYMHNYIKIKFKFIYLLLLQRNKI